MDPSVVIALGWDWAITGPDPAEPIDLGDVLLLAGRRLHG